MPPKNYPRSMCAKAVKDTGKLVSSFFCSPGLRGACRASALMLVSGGAGGERLQQRRAGRWLTVRGGQSWKEGGQMDRWTVWSEVDEEGRPYSQIQCKAAAVFNQHDDAAHLHHMLSTPAV